MHFIDSHAHIYAKALQPDLQKAMERVVEASVHKVLMPNIDHTSIDAMLEVELKYPDICHAMMGLHPCSVKRDFEKELYLMESWLEKRKFIAVGETGIDLFWDKTTLGYQQEAFGIQLAWAKKYKIPIVIHCRDAFEETIAVVERHYDETLTGVFHCFTGTKEDAARISALHFKMGIGGVATFKNGGLQQVLPALNTADLLLETDSPYLAPVPHRGKRNESAYIPFIAQKVADILEQDIEEVADFTTNNAIHLFKLPTV